MQIFNVHQATSGDIQLQQHTWQILTKSVVECKHQRILLGGDMTRVDALLENFVHDTQGELMSPSTVSWRRDNKSAKLDHIITWNPPHDGNTGSLGACWQSVGSGIPEGCEELDHPERSGWRTAAGGRTHPRAA
jgi:hypothetical protein